MDPIFLASVVAGPARLEFTEPRSGAAILGGEPACWPAFP